MSDSLIDFCIGELVLCLDEDGEWYRAEILQICETNGKLEYLIDYYGWAPDHREWVSSELLRPDNIQLSHAETGCAPVSDYMILNDSEEPVYRPGSNPSSGCSGMPTHCQSECSYTHDGNYSFNSSYSGHRNTSPTNDNDPFENEGASCRCSECRNLYFSKVLNHLNHLWAVSNCNFCENQTHCESRFSRNHH